MSVSTDCQKLTVLASEVSSLATQMKTTIATFMADPSSPLDDTLIKQFNTKKGEVLSLYETSLKSLLLSWYPREDTDDFLQKLTFSEEGISVQGNMDFTNITHLDYFPSSITNVTGSLLLAQLTSAEGLSLPPSIGRDLELGRLTSAEGLTLPSFIGGYLGLGGLTSAVGLSLPPSIGRDLDLRGLTSAVGLSLPPSIGRDLDLRGLTSAVGLSLPPSIGRDLDLRGLTSAVGLSLPPSIGGDLNLRGLTSAVGLSLPPSIGGDLNLRGLTSAVGLDLENVSIGRDLFLRGLPLREQQDIRARYPRFRINYD